MNTFEGSKHRLHLPRGLVATEPAKVKVKEIKSKDSEVGPLPTLLAGWTHLKAASKRLHGAGRIIG